MSPLLIIFLVGLFVIIILAGIVFYITNRVFYSPPSGGGNPVCGPGGECAEGTFCSGTGFCIPTGSCSIDPDCLSSEGEVCIGNVCVPRECSLDADCGQAGICDKFIVCPDGSRPPCQTGLCKTRCFNDGQCSGSSACVNGLCTLKRCLTQSDCNFDEACDTLRPVSGRLGDPALFEAPGSIGVCVPVQTPCFTNAQCTFSGTFCSSAGVCVQCNDDSQCSGNTTCINGVCLHPDQEGCSGNNSRISPCTGSTCSYYPVCCPSSCGSVCSDSTRCPASCPYCVNGRCTCKETPRVDNSKRCTNYNQCGSNGSYCLNGFCSFYPGSYGDRCVDNQDCARGLMCRAGLANKPICAP
ncbi:EGF-like [Cedratvirus A11]|uniref:EGF-like n=1 Tax=Cedratvirus A11 TaxID=1903266 RepID=A0A1M7XU88_9VIRU|nr:EGF-like [Cedratvirus A11]SHO33255.1 EGF-like [Cedratvirus A11]